MTWTTDKPTVPGWYWLRPKNKPARIVRVTTKTIASMYGIGGEWAGPLAGPLSPPPARTEEAKHD
jgi:hypothetical protein